VPAAYRLHLATLGLPTDVLALSEIDVHDGLMLDMQHEPQSAQLTLRFRCGDLLRGYFDLHVKYSGAALDNASLAVLRQAMQVPRDEFLYDEVDRAGDRFEHRFVLSSHNEVCVSFADVAVGAHPVASQVAE
jgi:hypothetical protein